MSRFSEEDEASGRSSINEYDFCNDFDVSNREENASDTTDQANIGPTDSIAGNRHSSHFTADTESTSAEDIDILKDNLQKLKQENNDLTQRLLDQNKTILRTEAKFKAKTREHARLQDQCKQDKKYFEDTVGKSETTIEEQLKEIQRLRCFEGQHSIQCERIQELNEQLQQSSNAQTELTNKLHDEERVNKSKEEIIQTLRNENNSLKEENLRDKKSYEDTVGKYETERERLLKEIQRLFYFEDQHSIQKECIRELNAQLAQSNNAKTELRKKLHRADCESKTQEEIIQALRKESYSLEEEKKTLLLRLSKMAGAKLTIDNPHIADLSDQKRPTRLAEEFAELYDNEWTDAFEDEKSANEQEKTAFMLKLLQRASEICSKVSNEHMNGIKRSVCTLTVHLNDPAGRTSKMHTEQQYTEPMTGPSNVKLSYPNTELSVQPLQVSCDSNSLQDEQKKSIIELRKCIEVSLSDKLEAVVADVIARENDIDSETPIAIFNYIKKCVNICWSMCRVEPPVFINFPKEQDDLRLDTNIYKAYTKTGNFVDYIVWPALHLHENGPLLCKGVAQGKA